MLLEANWNAHPPIFLGFKRTLLPKDCRTFAVPVHQYASEGTALERLRLQLALYEVVEKQELGI
jgi:hypothetical protein